MLTLESALFWFNMDCRLAIPSVAIPYGQRFIKITLANSTELVELVAPPGADNTDAGVLGNLTIADCTLYINNILKGLQTLWCSVLLTEMNSMMTKIMLVLMITFLQRNDKPKLSSMRNFQIAGTSRPLVQ